MVLFALVLDIFICNQAARLIIKTYLGFISGQAL
ncbi:hypothetical protein X793_05040 [Dehalococcoides mccartyi CG4]|nr:hypothetical protein X793_05040 [Dehalococcoides mccartyi CG4]